MLRYRDYMEHSARPSSRLWMAFATAAGFAVLPVLRLLCRVFPPLRRKVHDGVPARLGAAFHKRDRGDHQGAFAGAMEGLAKCAAAPDWQRATFPTDLMWWEFLNLGVREAEHLGDAERAQAAQALDAAPGPGGMLAAACLSMVARWKWRGGDRDGAIRLAKEAILADNSSVDGHVLLGWYGLITGRFDPLPYLREALMVDPSCAKSIRSNPEFAEAPGLLRSLGLREPA